VLEPLLCAMRPSGGSLWQKAEETPPARAFLQINTYNSDIIAPSFILSGAPTLIASTLPSGELEQAAHDVLEEVGSEPPVGVVRLTKSNTLPSFMP